MDQDLRTLLTLASFVAIGRVLLSLLPAGWPGRHDRRELGVTLATSFLLGMVVYLAQGAIAARLGWTMGFWPRFLPWIAVGALRLALSPAGLRPRHEPPRAPADGLARTAFGIGWVIWIGLILRHGTQADLGTACDLTATPLAGATLAVAGLQRARRSPRAQAAAWVAWGSLALGADDMTLATSGWPAAYLALGVTGTIAWLRRADRRGLAMAAIGFAAVGIAPTAAPLGAAGLIALVACTPAASRRRALGWAVATGAGALISIYSCLDDFVLLATQRPQEPLASLVWLVPLMALPMTVVWVRLARPKPTSLASDPPRRELLAYGVALSLAVVAAGIGDLAGGWPTEKVLAMLLPAAIVFALLAFATPEPAV